MIFVISIIFDSKKAFNIGNIAVIPIVINKNFNSLIQIQKIEIKKRKIIEKLDVITIILVNFAYILNITKTACQFLKLVFIFIELIEPKKEIKNKVVNLTHHVVVSVTLLLDIIWF